jgi:hypothetical protein
MININKEQFAKIQNIVNEKKAINERIKTAKNLNKNYMKNPKVITTLREKSTYMVPTYYVDNEGLQDANPFEIQFCKGNKEDESVFRQPGFFTETLIAVAKKYLEENNVGDLASRETAVAITKLDEALMWLNKRAEDRALRNVQGTYQK